MRAFETALDQIALPGVYVVARIDGRSFTRLTKEGPLSLDRPFDVRFRDAMLAATQHLMQCGFGSRYAYTQSDEISLLLKRDDETFGRRIRKIVSVLAGEASASFTHAFGHMGAFDCRLSLLPLDDDVVDYFRWRQEDAHRNALGAHCYWLLRSRGASDTEATRQLEGASVSARNELLFQHGVNFDGLPAWQKGGIGVRWLTYEKAGTNQKTGEAVTVQRRRLHTDLELPFRSAYVTFVRDLLEADET